MDRIDTQRPKGVQVNLAARTAPVQAAAARTTEVASSQAETVVLSAGGAGSDAPVDMDRVHVIRKAIEQGRYPMVPAKIADAMIAAGYLLRTR